MNNNTQFYQEGREVLSNVVYNINSHKIQM